MTTDMTYFMETTLKCARQHAAEMAHICAVPTEDREQIC